MQTFGQNLAQIRKLRNLTQLQLANLLDVHQRLISRWERNEGRPNFDCTLKLSKVLEISTDQLLKGKDANNSVNTFEINNMALKNLCKKVDQLSHDDQEVVCKVMDSMVRNHEFKKLADKR
jgi:transcriptional regulator with XRE-family HTH domain